MTHGITGRTHLEIRGERRTLVCDMNAAQVLFDQHGDQWQLWLAERFLGHAADPKEPHVRQLVPISPAERFDTLFALLASDIEDGGHPDTPKTLRRAFAIADLDKVTAAVMGAVLAGFHLPGETIEAVVNAVAGPRK